MTKKLLMLSLAATFICGQAGTVLAVNPGSSGYGDGPGCGLGAQIFNQKAVLHQVLAATTNGTLGNQTFGITTGTLGCSSDGVITAANRLPMFTGTNLDQLSAEMAAGEGEALEAMAELYGVEASDRAAFYSMTQQHYASIFSSEDVTAGDVLAAVDALMKSDARLARYVA